MSSSEDDFSVESDSFSDDFDDDDSSDFGATPVKKKAAAAKKAAKKASPAAAKKAKSAPAAAKAASSSSSVKAPSDVLLSPNKGVGGDSPLQEQPVNKSAKKGKKRTVEETYTKKTQYEHIRLRPDTYVGSVEPIEQKMWVFNAESKKMEERDITFVPGLYKIFDEILVNAADNYQRDNSMNKMKVNIDREAGTVSVWNNGRGIPIEMHKKEGVYVPELIFGHLLTSSNYNDAEKKVTGGRNGYGAKLCNIFSKRFIVETADASKGKVYKQVWTENMAKCGEPKISMSKKKNESWTRITFEPDFQSLNMPNGFDDDTIALLLKRAYDIAGVNRKVRMYINDEYVPMKSFQDYCDLYITEGDAPKIYEQANERWEVCVTFSNDQPQQVSFVNSIATVKGGTHVNHVLDKVVKPLIDELKKKKANVKPFQVKSHIFIFVNALIENPAFDSQTKETLTLQPSKFGSKCDLSDAFMKKIMKSGLIQKIKDWAAFKDKKSWEKKGSGKSRGRVNGIAKLDDANEAGGRNSSKCTLILTEGDSAKALAQAGVSVVGADWYGIFPLKGKLLNVRDASIAQLTKNEEINHIIQIMGLRKGAKYEDTKQLRYGHVLIMTDQDADGSHIKGLLINLFHKLWPSLLKQPRFLQQFVTPIVKATRGKEEVQFFSIPEYKEWKRNNNNGKGYVIKYYKGLGTSSNLEAKQYFSALEKHKIDFVYGGASDDEAIDHAFGKQHADFRKDWLASHDPNAHLDFTVDEVDFTTFVNKELVLFSHADCERSIPSYVDGLKPGQRKVLYVCLIKNLTRDYKVAQLAGAVGNKAAYHHGEMSLMSTIVNMAQDYVGSNNINLLYPSGQFGTRRQGGKDAASARYIFTRLSSITRHIFHPLDDDILTYLDDDGFPVEPQWYLPIIPMVLVNGAEGIGTGWSTSIPNHNPRDVIANIRRLLEGQEVKEMVPWYNGFEGEIVADVAKGNWSVTGIYDRLGDREIRIEELPIGKWTQDYKEWLEKGITGDDKNQAWVKDYKEHHTSNTVEFTIYTLKDLPKGHSTLMKMFRLSSSISYSNYVAFDQHGHVRKFSSSMQILREFFDLRLSYYHKRKAHLTDKLEREFTKLDNKVRFITEVCDGTFVVANRKKGDILKELREKKYDACPPRVERNVTDAVVDDIEEAKSDDEDDDSDEDYAANDEEKENERDFDYLLSLPIWSLTRERVNKLKGERDAKGTELEQLVKTDIKDMWRQDLDALEAALEAFYADQEEAEVKSARVAKRARLEKRKQMKEELDDEDFEVGGSSKKKKSKAAAKKTPVTSKKKKKSLIDDDDMLFSLSDSDDDDDGDFGASPSSAASTTSKPAAAKKSGGSSAAAFDFGAVEDDNDDNDAPVVMPSNPSPPKRAKTATPPKKKPAPAQKKKKKKTILSSSEEEEDDDDDFGGDDDSDDAFSFGAKKNGGGGGGGGAAAPAKRSRRAAASKVNFKDMLDSDEDGDGDDDDDDDSLSLDLDDDDEDEDDFDDEDF